MDYVILSAATRGSRYEQCIYKQRKLFKDHRYLGLIVESRGKWAENTKIKPEAVRRGFDECPVVLWIDSDCTIDPPDTAPAGDWDICTIRNIHPRHKIKISAGFIMFRDTQPTRNFLDAWDKHNKTAKKDHPAMIHALHDMRGLLHVSDMTPWLAGRHSINALAPERGVFAG